jgi:hypothetical protein
MASSVVFEEDLNELQTPESGIQEAASPATVVFEEDLNPTDLNTLAGSGDLTDPSL